MQDEQGISREAREERKNKAVLFRAKREASTLRAELSFWYDFASHANDFVKAQSHARKKPLGSQGARPGQGKNKALFL